MSEQSQPRWSDDFQRLIEQSTSEEFAVGVSVNHERPEAPIRMTFAFSEGRTFDLEIDAKQADLWGRLLTSGAASFLRQPYGDVRTVVKPDPECPGSVLMDFSSDSQPDAALAITLPATSAARIGQKIINVAMRIMEPQGNA